MDRSVCLNVSSFVCVPEEGPVVHTRLERDGTVVPIWVPGIDMCVQVDDRHGSVYLA